LGRSVGATDSAAKSWVVQVSYMMRRKARPISERMRAMAVVFVFNYVPVKLSL
jgi:hypothetical protein